MFWFDQGRWRHYPLLGQPAWGGNHGAGAVQFLQSCVCGTGPAVGRGYLLRLSGCVRAGRAHGRGHPRRGERHFDFPLHRETRGHRAHWLWTIGSGYAAAIAHGRFGSGQWRQPYAALRRQRSARRARKRAGGNAAFGGFPADPARNQRHHAELAGKRGDQRRRAQRVCGGVSDRRQNRHRADLRGRRYFQRHAHWLVHWLCAHGRPADRRTIHRGRGHAAAGLWFHHRRALCQRSAHPVA